MNKWPWARLCPPLWVRFLPRNTSGIILVIWIKYVVLGRPLEPGRDSDRFYQVGPMGSSGDDTVQSLLSAQSKWAQWDSRQRASTGTRERLTTPWTAVPPPPPLAVVKEAWPQVRVPLPLPEPAQTPHRAATYPSPKAPDPRLGTKRKRNYVTDSPLTPP